MKDLTLAEAIAALAAGQVVALPTDTVYGVGAALAHPAAVARLFALKGRPVTVALPVVLADADQVASLAVTWSAPAATLAAACWPGALTIVVPAAPALAALVGADASIGLRVPDDDTVRAAARAVGPLALTSANAHGAPPATTAADVRAALPHGLAGVVDAGTRDGAVSTVVDLTGPRWRVRRVGAISPQRLGELLGPGAD